ncbi:MAG TPA: hypothetical protein VEV15_04665, partial [Flavisolibacter sp.]|nr:hypothetical protein [Flavisolibacter sp.]
YLTEKVNMQQLAKDIAAIIADYHCDYTGAKAFAMAPEHVLAWVQQFKEADQQFILEEFLHLLRKGIYVNKVQAEALLWKRMQSLAARYKFADVATFFANTVFLDLQPAGKSQSVLLQMLDGLMKKNVGHGLKDCGKISQKYVIYLDDVIETGGTVFAHILNWLKEDDAAGTTNLQQVLDNKKTIIVSSFCLHTWALLMQWRWKMELKNDPISKKVVFLYDYEIQNHPSFPNQKFNFVYPCQPQPALVTNYFDGLTVSNKEEHAYRLANKPAAESFYSSPANRIRFENILLQKGIELLNAAATLKPNHRPLGMVSPSYKTFGTGTLFFTWRNISNTCPVVFWWKSADWKPLFPLHNRGLGNMPFGT